MVNRQQRREMRDMIVLLPGILGSVLENETQTLWGTENILRSMVNPLEQSLQNLRLIEDDPEREVLQDGIRATGLIRIPALIAGLSKTDDYSAISKMITDTFNVVRGNIQNRQSDANFFEFPYDWRRNCKFNAELLQKFIKEQLPQWQEHNPTAKVILLAHSMGGLICRYYLEKLDGWNDCRYLLTLGTPYNGSINALNFLHNGYPRIGFANLTDVVRSFTSVYQLLPTYKVLNCSGTYQKISETQGISNIEISRVIEALEFHQAMNDAAGRNHGDKGWQKYQIMVGVGQKTLQLATLIEENLECGIEIPDDHPDISQGWADGDGTVPRVSATPRELQNQRIEKFYSETHACLPNNKSVLTQIKRFLIESQLPEPKLGELEKFQGQLPSIAIEVEDVYMINEQVRISFQLLGYELYPEVITLAITPFNNENNKKNFQCHHPQNEWIIAPNDLQPGIYRVEVSAFGDRVQDIFLVSDVA
jgi:uncharacterized protein YerC